MKRLINILIAGLLVSVLWACSDDAADGGSGTTGGGTIDPPDTNPPLFLTGPVCAPDAERVQVSLSMSEKCTLYWVVFSGTTAAPNVSGIQSAGNSLQITNTASVSFFAESLTVSTAYVMYCAARDVDGNWSAVMSNSFTTTAAPDNDPPVFTAGPSVPVPAGEDSAVAGFTLNENATVYWLCLLSADPAPDVTAVRTGGASLQVSAAQATNIVLSGLSDGAGYTLYIMAEDSFANSTGVLTCSFTTASNTAPSFTVPPAVDGTTGETNAVVTCTIDETATVYWVCHLSNAGPPDAAAIKAAGNSVSATAGSAVSVSLSGLSSGTGYVVYMFAEDASGKQSGVESAAFSTAASVAATTFGIFSDTIPLDVIWDTNVFLRIWSDWSAGCTIQDVASGAADGGLCWKITGTGAWIGIGIEPSSSIDLSSYSYLVFSYRGTKNFKLGIKSASGTERWVESTTMVTSYGLALDDAWHEVKIPFSAFSGIDFGAVGQYFMFVADSARGYSAGDVHYLDNLHFSDH